MKDKLGPYHFDDIMRMMLDIFPEMELGEDLDGQLIVHTGWECASSDGFYTPMKEYENRESNNFWDSSYTRTQEGE